MTKEVQNIDIELNISLPFLSDQIADWDEFSMRNCNKMVNVLVLFNIEVMKACVKMSDWLNGYHTYLVPCESYLSDFVAHI